MRTITVNSSLQRASFALLSRKYFNTRPPLDAARKLSSVVDLAVVLMIVDQDSPGILYFFVFHFTLNRNQIKVGAVSLYMYMTKAEHIVYFAI